MALEPSQEIGFAHPQYFHHFDAIQGGCPGLKSGKGPSQNLWRHVEYLLRYGSKRTEPPMANQQQLELLHSGTTAWNAWRTSTNVLPDLVGACLSQADLRDAQLAGARLSGAEFRDAQLTGADLTGADLRGALFEGAYLVHADLSDADLRDADLSSADLRAANLNRTDLRGANLTSAYLVQAQLIGTRLQHSVLDRSCVYGAAVWDVDITGASQKRLRISHPDDLEITIDDLEMAQFVYLLLHNPRIRTVIDTLTTKAVLLLGRFTAGRKTVLEAIHSDLRRRGYLPILFDFDRPSSRDITETILTLAGIVRFVIADLTEAASVSQELTEIARALPSVPVRPILLRGSEEWRMFRDLQRRGPVLAPYTYTSAASLIAVLAERVIDPAERLAEKRRMQLNRLYRHANDRVAKP